MSQLPQGEEKRKAVQAMFDTIAPRYDLVNRVMTFRMDVAWRRRTVADLGLAPGSVVVDLAAESGGNCELSRPGEDVDHHGVLVWGGKDVASSMPVHASQLYARNVSALLLHLAPDGELALDFDDEITAGACVSGRREVTA